MTKSRNRFRNMLLVVRQELRYCGSERWIPCGCIAFGLVIAGALLLAWSETRTLQSQTASAQAAARLNWLSQGDRDPHGAAHHGTFLYKKVSPFAGVDSGMTPHLGSTLRIEAHVRHHLTNAADATWCNPIRQSLGTPAAIVSVSVPLLAILIGFASVTRERAGGTLPLLLIQGASWKSILVGKTLAAILLVIASIFPFFICLAAHAWEGFLNPTSGSNGLDIALRAALLVVGTVCFVATWCAICTAVSARSRSSQTALLSLLAGWLFALFLIPAIATQIAAAWYPLPSQEAFQQWAKDQKYGNNDGKNVFSEIRQQVEARLLKQYGVSDAADLPVNLDGIHMQESEKITDQLYSENEQRLRTNLAQQERLIDSVCGCSPYYAMRSTSMALTMTDRLSHEHFSDQAERFRQHLVAVVNDAYAIKASERGESDRGRLLWEKVGEFEYEFPRVGLVFQERWWPLANLACWFVVSLCLLWWSPVDVT